MIRNPYSRIHSEYKFISSIAKKVVNGELPEESIHILEAIGFSIEAV